MRNIRRDISGKFNYRMDEIAWNVSMNGFDVDWYGDSDIGEYASLVSLPDHSNIAWWAKDTGITLNYAETAYILRHPWAILMSDSRGFVHVEYYEREEDAGFTFDGMKDDFDRHIMEDESPADFYGNQFS